MGVAVLIPQLTNGFGSTDLDTVYLTGNDHFLFNQFFADFVIPDLHFHPPVELPDLFSRIARRVVQPDRLRLAHTLRRGEAGAHGGDARDPVQAGRLADVLTKAGPVAAVVATTLLVWGLGLADRGVAIVGEVPRGAPEPELPSLELLGDPR